MPDRLRTRPTDPNELARQIVDEATAEREEGEAATPHPDPDPQVQDQGDDQPSPDRAS